MKRILSLALVLVMILGVIPVASAASGECYNCHQECEIGAVPCNPNNGNPFPGGFYYTCSHCGIKGFQPGVENHVTSAGARVENTATCTEPGVKTTYCDCGLTNSQQDVPALGHTDENEDGICDVCNNSTAPSVVFSLSVSPASLEVRKGSTGTITASIVKNPSDATVAPADMPTITYTSGNTAIATVSGGTVSGVAVGTTTITVNLMKGSEVLDTETVDVEVYGTGTIGNIADMSTTLGTVTLAPTLTIGSSTVSNVTYVYSGDATTATVTGSNQVKTVTVSVTNYTVDGEARVNAGEIPSKTIRISFYTSHEVEVTLKDNVSSFLFKDATAVTGGVALSVLIGRTDNSNSPQGHNVTFGKLEDAYGKLTMPSPLNVDTVAISDLYGLGDVKFTVLNNTDGYWATSYTIKDSTLTYATGVITINFKESDAAIKYSTTSGKAFQLDSADFKSVWNKAGYTGTPTYVRFEDLPYYGDLYETSAQKVKVTTTDYLYLAATGSKLDLDNVTYVPYGLLTNYTDEVTFAIYGGTNDATVVYGVMEVKVGETMKFTDVKTTDYFYEPVVWAVSEGITSGLTATTFGPNATCTRAQVVTFLYRAAGEPVVYGSLPFTDVKYTDYYYDAVLWAYQNDITTGLTATTFGPNATVTRGQVVTFLHRALGEPYGGSYNPFTDVKSSDYYADAVLWAYKNDVTTGLTATSFGPASGCTRGQIVTFLYRAYEGK